MTSKSIGYAVLACLLALACPREADASRVERASFQSEHFEYLIDSSKTAIIPYASALFEDSYRRLTGYFDFRPDGRVRVLFLDEDDIGNGYAFAAQGWVVIMLPAADFDLRGRTAWLPNVIAHELTHVITLRKMGETSRFLGFQLLADISLGKDGNLDAGVDWRWYRTPAWFAEGLAQYGSQTCGYDTLDTFRRMILETARASGSLLSLPEMADYGWDVRRDEMVYTQGYSFTAFLFGKYGREAMNRVLDAMRRDGFASAFRKEVSHSPEELYREWAAQLAPAGANLPPAPATRAWSGVPVNAPYVNQASPVAAPDGSIAYLTSARNDFGVTDLYVRKGDREFLAKRRAAGPLNVSPDGKILYFTVLSVSGRTGRSLRDLYQYSFANGIVTRLTWNKRVISAAPAAGGVVYVLTRDGGLAALNRLDRDGLVRVAEYPVQFDLSGLATGGEAGKLLAEVSTGRGTDIYSIDVADGRCTPIMASRFDERNPRWDGELGCLLFSADYSGAYQVYCLRNDSLFRWTNDERNHLDPMARNGSLYDRVYSPGGFLLDSSAVPADPSPEPRRDSLAPNAAFPIPASTLASRKAWADDGMRFLGYSGFGRIERVAARYDLFGAADSSSPLFGVDDPGRYYKWTAGGAGLWMHPGEESQVFVAAGISDEVDRMKGEGPYLSQFAASYTDRSFGPEISGDFVSVTDRLPARDPDSGHFDYTLIRFSLACDWRLGNYVSLTGFADYSGISVKSRQELATDFSGGGTFFGGQFQALAYQPGVDFPDELLAFWSGFGYVPDFGIRSRVLNWNGLSMATNSFRRIFYQASLETASELPDDLASQIRGSAQLSLDLPASLRVPFPGNRSLYLAAVLPAAGLGFTATSAGRGSSAAAYASLRPFDAQIGTRATAFEQMASPLTLGNGQVDLILSTTLKLVSPLNSVVYWDFYYAIPIRGIPGDGYYGISLNL